MKIYFAGSIKAGRDDTDIYQQIILLLQSYGTVLTEHIGLKSLTDQGEDLPAKEIHDRDMAWLLESDIVIAEVTTPSLGVGYEIGRALEHQKRVIVLYRGDLEKLSSMIQGSSEIEVINYRHLTELENLFASVIK